VVDWLSLIGDAVDNIPGVPGIGPKTATELLRRFGTVEALLGRLGEVKSERQRTELLGAAENVRRNQRMVALKCDLVGGPALEALVPARPDVTVLRTMYRSWGFRSLLAELGPEPEPVTEIPAGDRVPEQGTLF
jgi:DNA polymerase-1